MRKYIAPKNLRKGGEYAAFDSLSSASLVKILSVKKDKADWYEIDVKYLDGEEKGKNDQFYLPPDAEVFTDKKLYGENTMAKKRSTKLKDLVKENFMGIAYPTAINNPFDRPKKQDNFKFKGFPGQFDKNGKKIAEDNGETLKEDQADNVEYGKDILNTVKEELAYISNRLERNNYNISEEEFVAVFLKRINKALDTPQVSKAIKQLNKSSLKYIF